MAKEFAVKLTEGDPAPAFTAAANGGGTVSLADFKGKSIVKAYGVWGQKSFLGKPYLGIHRITFLIAPDGRIKKIWRKVKPGEHAKEVLAAL